MRHMIMLAAPLALAACTTGDGYRTAQAEEARAEVEERLVGYAPVGTRSCLPGRSQASTQVYADGTILVRQAGSLYGQNLGPSCASASDIHTALVTEGTFGNMCAGTIARVVDSSTGLFRGSCSIGDWTQYKKVEEADEAG